MGDTVAGQQAKPSVPVRLTLEAWSQGFMVGALIIMCGITLANMRRGVLLHKLILLELVLALPNGFFIFFDPPAWGWFLSSTVVPLIASWTLHNVIAWMKSRPFLGRRGNFIYIGSVALVQPYWILEIYANFVYFNGNRSHLFTSTRPYEALFRDPWWIFTIVNLFWNIMFRYELGFIEIVRVSPRFGILLLCMALSVISIIVDLLSVTPVIPIGVINPFWKFAFVFKCFTDSIILDDFKSALDKLSHHRMSQILPFNVLEDAESERGGIPQRERKWPGKYGGKPDRNSVMEVDTIYRKPGMELDDGGLCSPSPVVIRHVENNART
ncbi:hypothetical protein QBC44DRAFT_297936 [Cladorrhinum sp. PSN332]|nr:hypothetical protein QBC44DRAFT_297936 [Cladorrhinum sp. PSN332]